MNSLPIKATIRLCQFAMTSSLCALVAGCHNDPYLNSHIEVLNAEKRVLEDQLYELEYDYERKAAELDEAQQRLSELDAGSRGSNASPRVQAPESEDSFPDFSPPTVIPGVPDNPSLDLPEPSPGGRSPRRNSDTEPRLGPTRIEPEDPRITHIHIDPLSTGGSDFDRKPGDDGILVVVEPRNQNDAFVPLAGPMSIVVLDYAKRGEGDGARIAKWDLTAQQVDQTLQNNASQRGIYLRLPWSNERPRSGNLMVAVRYTTADGRTLEATHDIVITLPGPLSQPGQLSQRWTPRASGSNSQQNRTDVARQPSATERSRSTPVESPVAPAASAVDVPSDTDSPRRPSWRPYR